MADNDKAQLRYDEFVGNVQPDPAKPQSTILLSGFVGHGPEGHARIYPDPTLGTWYDVPDGDVIHSTPIADSKLGGSYVWVRASAEIKPGNAAPSATEAVQPHAPAAVQPPPTAGPPCGITLDGCTGVTLFVCPHTQAIHCPTQPVVCDTMQQPTPATRCFICPPLHTQQVWCPTKPVVCNIQPQGAPAPTPATACTMDLTCPPTLFVACRNVTVECAPSWLTCQLAGVQPHAAAMAAAAPPNTAATLCTAPQACFQTLACPTRMGAGCTASTLCIVCPTLDICAPTVGGYPCVTAPSGLCAQAPHAAAGAMNPTLAALCTAVPPCLPTIVCATAAPGCWTAPSGLCAQAPHAAAAPHQGGAQHQEAAAGAAAAPNTAALDCYPTPICVATPATQCIICPPGGFSVAVCDTVVCHMQQVPHRTPFCTIPPNCPAQTALVACPTQLGACTLPIQCLHPTWFACQLGGAQPHAAAMAAAAPLNTAATLCTAPQACFQTLGCPSILCQTVAAGCWTAPSGLCAAAPQAAAAGPAQTAPPATQGCFPTVILCPTGLDLCPTLAPGCWTAPSGLCALPPTPNGVFTPFGR